MISAYLILMIVALICFLLAAIGRPATAPISLGWLGLFFYVLAILVGH
jgi:hypothetical protein